MGVRKIWIDELFYRIENEIQRHVDADRFKKSFSEKFLNEIRRLFISRNNGYFDPKLCEQLLLESTTACKEEQITDDKFQLIRWICQYMQECFSTGTITYKKLPRLGYQNLLPFYIGIVNKYASLEEERNVLSPGVIKTRKISIGMFLRFLQERGHETFETVEASDIRAFIPFLAKRQPKGIVQTLPIIRKFCILMNESGVFKQKWETILNVKAPRYTTVRTSFTKTEIEKLLRSPDRSTPMGLRDYAMMLLSAATGIRSIDIIKLKLSDIDWRANELMIMQSKTGRPLRLPLLPEVGNAISEYILNGRPKTSSEHVFVSTQRPYGKLASEGNSIVQNHIKKAGIPERKELKRGFHSFRRAIGTRMLEAEVPIEIISQILGHSDTEATKPYLSVDFTHLKECALDFSEFPCLRGELC